MGMVDVLYGMNFKLGMGGCYVERPRTVFWGWQKSILTMS
jgi:hypothetical protein